MGVGSKEGNRKSRRLSMPVLSFYMKVELEITFSITEVAEYIIYGRFKTSEFRQIKQSTVHGTNQILFLKNGRVGYCLRMVNRP